MPSPRADWRCAKCAKKAGVPEVIHEDLPIESTRCPVTGARRGFARIFSSNVATGPVHKAAKLFDGPLREQYDTYTHEKGLAKEGEQRLKADYEHAAAVTPQLRAALPKGPVEWRPAGAAMGLVSPAAASDSRQFLFPHHKRHIVGVRP